MKSGGSWIFCRVVRVPLGARHHICQLRDRARGRLLSTLLHRSWSRQRGLFRGTLSRMGQLLQCWHYDQSVSRARQLHSRAVAPVAAIQAQSQTTQGRELSTPAPLRDLRARASDPAWTRRAVDEGVTSCPRAGCREIRMSGCVSSEGWHVQQGTNLPG